MSSAIRIAGGATQELTSDATRFYDGYWQDGATVSAGTIGRQQDLLRAIFPSRPRGRRVLELGVGAEGGLIAHLASANEVFGLDASPVAVSSCARFGLTVRQFNADRDEIPFADDHFDIVLAFEVCEHFANPQFALEQIRRVLKPGGVFIASWIWICRNAEADADALVLNGRECWTRLDSRGIRTRTMEAADLFRAAHALDPTDVATRGLLAATQVYRVINGEDEEFKRLVRSLNHDAGSGSAVSRDAKYWLCVVQIELSKFGWPLLPDDHFARFIAEIAESQPDRAAELRRLSTQALTFAIRLGRLG